MTALPSWRVGCLGFVLVLAFLFSPARAVGATDCSGIWRFEVGPLPSEAQGLSADSWCRAAKLPRTFTAELRWDSNGRPTVGAAWERAFVTFACDEINGLYDRIAAAIANGEPAPPALKARLLPILQALSWDREVAIRRAWESAKRTPDRPEDAFAPAIILSTLHPEDAAVGAWVAQCPPQVRQALAALSS